MKQAADFAAHEVVVWGIVCWLPRLHVFINSGSALFPFQSAHAIAVHGFIQISADGAIAIQFSVMPPGFDKGIGSNFFGKGPVV